MHVTCTGAVKKETERLRQELRDKARELTALRDEHLEQLGTRAHTRQPSAHAHPHALTRTRAHPRAAQARCGAHTTRAPRRRRGGA